MKCYKYCAALAIIAVGCCVVACGGDDDDDVKAGGGKASTSAGVLDKKSGLRIKSFGDYRVYYTDNGLIDYISEGSYGRYEFSYSPNAISYVDGYDDDDETITVGYNSSGYLASVSSSFTERWNDDYWEESSKATLSYDGSGHLTKISGSGKENGYEDGERYTDTWSFSYTFTWRNNRLMQVVFTEKDVEDGKTETETETYTYEYDNEDYVNEYRQWTPSIARCFDDLEEVLAYVGLLGVGPSELPSSGEEYEEESYDGKTYSDEESYTFRYGFNSDGSVSYTSINGTRYNFSYDYVDTDRRSTRAAWQQPQPDVRQISRLFRHSHHSRAAK